MLLSNDAVEGSDVAGLGEGDRVFLLTKRHVQRLREQFGITHSGHVGNPMVTLQVPPEFQAQLASLWQAYLPVQGALAADNQQQAQSGLRSLAAAIQSIDANGLNKAAGDGWKQEAANLSDILSSLQKSDKLDSFRSAFALLSDEMSVIAKSFGFGSRVPVYELHCPMAFQGRGAIWLQADDATKNPYFGSTMLKCADKLELITKPPVAETNSVEANSAEAHGGHAHD